MSEAGIPDNTPEPAPTETNPGAGDYHGRIQTEPEFALEEVKKKDSHIGKLHEEMKQYEPFKQAIASGFTPEQILQLAYEGDQARRTQATNEPDPKPTEPQQTEDEIYDPEIKALSERQKQELADRDARIAQLESRLNVTEARAARGTLEDNTAKALAVFEGHPELLEEAKEQIMSAVEVSERQAQGGDEQARINLDNLAGERGVSAMRIMTQAVTDKLIAKLSGQGEPQETNADGNPAMSHATDEPSSTRANPPQNQVTVGAGRKVNSNLMREVLEKATVAAGKDPKSLWG